MAAEILPFPQETRAIIYCRVSSDAEGRSRSVGEQEAECRAVCERNGWPVAEVLADNDVGVSRYSRVKDRPAYDRLKQILRPGDVLVLWEASRASRRLDGYVELRDLCASRGVLWNIGGQTYDPAKSNDRVMTGIRAILSEDEAEQTRQRVQRAHRHNAEAGRAHGTAFGYRVARDPDTGRAGILDPATGNLVTRQLHPEQAPIVREMATRVLAGESVWAIAKDLNERGVPTARGAAKWHSNVISMMLKKPTYAGLRAHHGALSPAEAQWEPIITVEQHRALVAILSDPTRRTQRGTQPRHLLSGIATCGVCGGRMTRFLSMGRNSYRCHDNGCVSRIAEPVERMVEEVLLRRLELIDGIAELEPPDVSTALSEVQELRDRLAGFADDAAEGKVSRESFYRIEARLREQIGAAERRARRTLPKIVEELVGPNARANWKVMGIDGRRAVARALLTVEIRKAPRSGRRFLPEYVHVDFR
ncbi:recombinase family protein [Rhodococcus rhodnii]|uniref:Integrase n=2 Tax=Rhodococcus rhodnii TaxID=38312 RepID=R7WUC8_9NOCA|nr:recombinase family protein [Rhodococcus rhodnii]EOM77759.1 integrase [Rhodococcus rhodnii LMG 5362]TXG89038.1 recombinase family protein [Rhodococcus rhodnii]